MINSGRTGGRTLWVQLVSSCQLFPSVSSASIPWSFAIQPSSSSHFVSSTTYICNPCTHPLSHSPAITLTNCDPKPPPTRSHFPLGFCCLLCFLTNALQRISHNFTIARSTHSSSPSCEITQTTRNKRRDFAIWWWDRKWINVFPVKVICDF